MSAGVAAAYLDFIDPRDYSGISFAGSEVLEGQVTDGFSKTLLVGEKYLDPALYETSADPSDWGHLLSGLCQDYFRFAGRGYTLQQDEFDLNLFDIFGSPHSRCHFVLCDGAVRPIDYTIDERLYHALASRDDGD